MISLNKHLSSSSSESTSLDLLFKPSWLSGLVIVLVSLGLILGTVLSVQYQESSLRLLRAENTQPHTLSTGYKTIDTNFSTNTAIGYIPLFIFWAGIGLIVYSFTMAAVNAVRNAAELEAETHYVNVNRQALLLHAAERVILRFVVLVAWLLYIKFTLHVILPYALAVAYAATGSIGYLASVGYILWGISLLCIGLHLHIILMRLFVLRPRLFGQVIVPSQHT